MPLEELRDGFGSLEGEYVLRAELYSEMGFRGTFTEHFPELGLGLQPGLFIFPVRSVDAAPRAVWRAERAFFEVVADIWHSINWKMQHRTNNPLL